jgi:hypothetical protein
MTVMVHARPLLLVGFFLCASWPLATRADVGDPQVKTDHPWYPGELSCSTFERLFATQAELYRRVTGIEPQTEHDKALASWLWRNLHFFHAEEGSEDLWGGGFTQGGALETREYWTGLFAHGFGLCYTSHQQWVAEMEALLGHGRCRGAFLGEGVHHSFEVFLTGGPYGAGQWALLDHDISTVVFNKEGTALVSIPGMQADLDRLTDPTFTPERQHGWPMFPYALEHGKAFAVRDGASYLDGYGGPPPMVHLRRGETLRRYLRPGLEDGKTFVFWGLNYNQEGVPGPHRWAAWVDHPEEMRRPGGRPGQARFANAVYTYKPDFTNGDYREGVIEEGENRVVFEFTTPYIIAATPSNDETWGVYDPGGKNGLVLRGKPNCRVSVSVDRGRTWRDGGTLTDGMDLTDCVKGRRQYFLRFEAGPKSLADADLSWTTVCQASASVMPRLKEGGSKVCFEASGRAIVSAGPNREQARTHLVAGAFDTPALTLQIGTPRKESPLAVYAAAHAYSGNPPDARTSYQIEYSSDLGKTWKPVVRDWKIIRREPETEVFWGSSFCWGSIPVSSAPVQVRFSNDGQKSYGRAEAHLVYQTPGKDSTKVTFDWTDDEGARRESHVFGPGAKGGEAWEVRTGRNVETRWVEFEPVVSPP